MSRAIKQPAGHTIHTDEPRRRVTVFRRGLMHLDDITFGSCFVSLVVGVGLTYGVGPALITFGVIGLASVFWFLR